MVNVGDRASDFTAPLVDDDIRPFTLSDNLDEAPIVLAFFPAAFTGTCTAELCTFENRLSDFESLGATVYGVSVDTPFSLAEFRHQEDLSFGLISDHTKTIIDAYDVRDDFDAIGYHGLARRATFILDAEATVTWRWIASDPGQQPDYDAVEEAVEATA